MKHSPAPEGCDLFLLADSPMKDVVAAANRAVTADGRAASQLGTMLLGCAVETIRTGTVQELAEAAYSLGQGYKIQSRYKDTNAELFRHYDAAALAIIAATIGAGAADEFAVIRSYNGTAARIYLDIANSPHLRRPKAEIYQTHGNNAAELKSALGGLCLTNVIEPVHHPGSETYYHLASTARDDIKQDELYRLAQLHAETNRPA